MNHITQVKKQEESILMKTKHENKEVWTDAPCFMISVNDTVEVLYKLLKDEK